MEPTNEEQQPEAVLRLPNLDTDLIQTLSRHWLVIIEKQDDVIKMELHTRNSYGESD